MCPKYGRYTTVDRHVGDLCLHLPQMASPSGFSFSSLLILFSLWFSQLSLWDPGSFVYFLNRLPSSLPSQGFSCTVHWSSFVIILSLFFCVHSYIFCLTWCFHDLYHLVFLCIIYKVMCMNENMNEWIQGWKIFSW